MFLFAISNKLIKQNVKYVYYSLLTLFQHLQLLWGMRDALTMLVEHNSSLKLCLGRGYVVCGGWFKTKNTI